MCERSQCKSCNVNFVDENYLRIHTEEFHTFRCEHLDKVFGNYDCVDKHVLEAHASNNKKN